MTPTEKSEEETTTRALAPANVPLAAEPTTAGDSTDAGDVDPDGTHAAEETGQGGDPTEPAKNKAHPWNG